MEVTDVLVAVLATYMRLIWKYYAMRPDYDVMVVGYPGQFDLFLARLLTWQRGRPLVWDILMSIHLISVERGLHLHSPWIVNVMRRIEHLSTRLPDLLIMDTEEYAAWFGRTYSVPRQRFRLVPIGADSATFRPGQPVDKPSAGNQATGRCLHVLHYGTFTDNHGVLTIIEAARRLAQHQDIRFELIGDGPQRPAAEEIIRRHGLSNVQMVGWLDQESLRERIAAADLCLGVFGTTPQSLITVHNKIKECLAMGKPVLTGDSPAVRRVFEHERHLYLCRRADPLALAAAIVELQQRPRLRWEMGLEGRAEIVRHYTIEEIGALFKHHLLSVARGT